MWGAEAEDHNKEPVLALAFAESLEGLPGGGAGHAGWLISSSRGMLNLWECTPGSASGDPALMVQLLPFQSPKTLRSNVLLLKPMKCFARVVWA